MNPTPNSLTPTPDSPTPSLEIELLDAAPPVMSRPLALIEERTYVAVWLNVRVPDPAHPSSLEQAHLQRFIIRDDGVLFGEGADVPLQDLGIAVALPEMPKQSRTWSAAGVKAYRAGIRPDPVQVFRQVTAVVNRFVDFDRSLAGQQTMAELIACYILATWFLPAFNVIGYLWPTGERGSGKTILLHTVAEMAYLGHVLLAGGSYASLRDLAEYGATLAFDDAENLTKLRGGDADKRALLLAGNRRGSTVTVKERGLDKVQVTRHINAFCPRLFSAIQLPDNVLASRSIVIPLVRTADRDRANADPLDHETWPHDRRQLVDDLWALALSCLPELRQYEKTVSEKARLVGRDLEPWRALLAIALWLDARDATGTLRRPPDPSRRSTPEMPSITGLWDRLHTLSCRYQQERQDLEADNITVLVVKALWFCASSATRATSATSATNIVMNVPFLASVMLNPESPQAPCSMTVTTQNILDCTLAFALHQGSNIENITESRVGRTLGRLRLEKVPRPGGAGGRRWRITLDQVQRLTQAYGLDLPLTDQRP
jgi:hypothetical protein